MNKSIILLILILLLSGCIGVNRTDITYICQSDPNKIPTYNQVLTLRTDGTYILNTTITHYFNLTEHNTASGTYTETDRSVILAPNSFVLSKNGSNLTDSDGDLCLSHT
jgi:hypothetical protein